MKSPKKIRQEFRSHGICIAEWARERGFHRLTVFDLLRGKRKGLRGEAHRAAVALGLKAVPKTGKGS